MLEKTAQIQEKLRLPLVFIGLMGAGKTEIGQRVARDLELNFYDSDAKIIESAGLSIPAIFEKHGEPYFRTCEKQAISGLLDKGPCVVSVGGGAVMNAETAKTIEDKSISIWLDAPVEVLLERATKDKERPLLHNDNPLQTLNDLLEERKSTYAQAKIRVNSENDAESVVQSVLEAVQTYLEENA